MSNDPRVAGSVPARKRKKASAPSKPPVTVVQVHRGIWRTAMKLAGGDRSRVEVETPTRLWVR